MDPAVPWQYTYNRLAAQGATSGDLHHHFAQAANNSALGGGHASSVSAVPSTTSQLLLQAAHSTPLGASSASFASPSSFLSAPSYDVFSPLFHHANPKPAHFNPINAAAQHRQQVLAAQAAVTKQAADSDIIRENYTPHHSAISTPQTGSYFEQPSGASVAAALSWQARGQTDFTTLRSQGDINSNNQLPSAFGILPHENVSPSPAPSSATKHSSSSGSSAYESFNAHFSQPLNQANAIIKSSSTAARSMSPQQSQQIKQQTIASTSAPSTSVYYQAPSSSSTYQNLQSSFANSKSIGQQEQLQHQPPQQHGNYSNSSNHTISGSKSSFTSSSGISSSSQLNSSSDPSTSLSKDYSNSSHHHISTRVKSERSSSPVIASQNYVSSAPLHKLPSVNHVQMKVNPKVIVPNSSSVGATSLNQNANNVQGHGHGHGHGQGQASAIHNNVIQSSPISFSMLENQVAYSGSNNNNNSSHSASNINTNRNASSSVRKQEFQHNSASSIPNSNATTDCSHSHIVIPRRPSPQQISSQPSPHSAVPSPAYPMYNSPMNPSPSPIDASISRTSSSKSNQVAYSSVIQRAALPSSSSSSSSASSISNWLDGPNALQNNNLPIYNQTPAQITKLHQISPPVHSIDSQQSSSHFGNSSQSISQHNQTNLTAQKTLNNSLQQIQSNQTNTQFAQLNQYRQRQTTPSSSASILSDQIIKKVDDTKSRPGRKKKVNDRADLSDDKQTSITNSEYYNNANERIPPPAHIPNQQSNGQSSGNFNNIHSHNSTMISHPTHHAIPHTYFPPYSMPLGIGDYTNELQLNSVPMVANNIPYNDSLGTPSVSSNYSPTASEIREDEPPKVVVPNIEEELGFLAENNRSGSMQPTSTQLPPPHQASTQNHLTLLANANNSLSHHNQSSQQQQSHMQHTTSHTGQNLNNSQSSSSNQMSQPKTTPMTDKKFATPTGPGSGFMQSYLKFLQGERDTSPPPVNRSGGGRKTWSRGSNQQTVSPAASTATSSATQTSKIQMSNGINMHSSMVAGGGNTSTAYDRKRIAPTDDDDDTSDSSNYKSTNKNSKKQSQQSVVERAPQVPIINAAKKARTTQSSHNNSLLSSQSQSPSSNALSLQQNHSLQQNPQLLMPATSAHQLVAGTSQILSQQNMYYPQDEDPLSVPQRRETTHRKAKGRSIMSAMQKQTFGQDLTDDLDEPPEFIDSESEDPAWTPHKTNEDDDDDDMPRRKVTRKARSTKSGSKLTTTKSNFDAGNAYSDLKEKPSNTSSTQHNYGVSSGNSNNPDDFQPGDFICSRQDIFLDWPSIWRVNSKTLLQKFEPFNSNNKTIYRSLSIYAQWSPENRRSYILVKCIHVQQLQHEVHVQLQRSDLCTATSEMYIEKVIQDTFAYQEQFEVYIQTLISQALDSNFLTEIMQEQDDYFISNVKTIDDLTTQRKLRLRNTMTTWPTRILHLIETWPCFNIIADWNVTNNGQIICAACNKRNITSKIVLFGQPYNPNTIGPTSMDSRFSFDKDFLLCRSCTTRCELLHKISHQKYLMFMKCSQKVAEKNAQDSTKGSTVILNELLADETWLGQLFKIVRRTWAEVDQIDREHRFSS